MMWVTSNIQDYLTTACDSHCIHKIYWQQIIAITTDAATKAYSDIENLLPKETVDVNLVFSEVMFIVPNAPRQRATEIHINHLSESGLVLVTQYGMLNSYT
jgi:hypothetical protein